MKRRADTALPLPGIAAQWDGICPRCDGAIVRDVSRISFVRGVAIHVGCASGSDDE